jgi:streptogramin lyase
MSGSRRGTAAVVIAAGLLGWISNPAEAAVRIDGQVQAGRGAVNGSTVTLWAASADAPARLAQATTGTDGSFAVSVDQVPDGSILYLVATGGTPSAGKRGGNNPAIALLAVLGGKPPAHVVVNEVTTVASVVTAAQFIEGTALKGPPLALRIAAGNVPNFADIATGGYGATIQDPLNSSQTSTLAGFATLADLLAGCATEVMPDACARLFAAAAPPAGAVPTDTLAAAEAIARAPWHQAGKLFALLDAFYPVPAGAHWRAAPFMPYLSFAPGAWTLPLVFAGGGMNSLGGIAIDGEGNMWADDNFLVGAQSTIYRNFGGGISEVAPNGTPLSPMTFGYRGGGIDGPGFGIAISADDKVWATSLAGKTISVFDRLTGKPLSPETGYNFGGQLGSMQGIITTPNGDVWALDNQRDQIVYLPKGDATKGRILGRIVNRKPVDGTLEVIGPFHLAVDQQDRIWVTNGGSNTVTRFPASDPGKAEQITVGYGPRAVAIDSLGNAWIANTIGHPSIREKLALVRNVLRTKLEEHFGSASKDEDEARMWIGLYDIVNRFPGGDVSMVRPDGTVLASFDGGKSIIGPWGVAIDGNDNVWVANAMGRSVTLLCGARPVNCPPGTKTGDPISPPGGYIGGLQIITDVAVDPAGNLWVANNWDTPEQGLKRVPAPALSTRFGGNGTVVFYGVAKPVRTPLIGPPRLP